MLARYCELLSIEHRRLVLEQATGSRSVIVTTLLPRLADFVANAFGNLFDPVDFARDHSAFNYLVAFMSPADRATFMESLLTVAGPVGKRHGQTGITMESHLLFCPGCLKEDVATHSQGYWRTTHQLPGVYFCASHGEPLLTGVAPSRTDKLVLCDGECLPGDGLRVLFEASFARRVASESAWLVRNGMPAAEPADAASALRRLIIAAGWSDGKGKVSSSFIRHLFAESGLDQRAKGAERLGLPINMANLWVTPGTRARPPLGQIMTVVALGRSLKELAAEIHMVQREQPAVKKRKATARRPASAEATRQHRKAFLAILKAHPDASRTELSSRLAVYRTRYLAAYDGEWLEAHMPAKRTFDWATVDAKTAAKVPDARRELLARPGRPKRVTESGLARAVTTVQQYATAADKLPLTRAAIGAAAETIERVRLRRIAWKAARAVIDGEAIERFELRVVGRYTRSLERYVEEFIGLMAEARTHSAPARFMMEETARLMAIFDTEATRSED